MLLAAHCTDKTLQQNLCKENRELETFLANSGAAVGPRLLRSQAKYKLNNSMFTLKHSRVVSSKAWDSRMRDWACAFRTGMKANRNKALYSLKKVIHGLINFLFSVGVWCGVGSK